MKNIIAKIDGYLYQLGWSRNHPRIKNYLALVANRLLVLEFQSLEVVPFYVLQRLERILFLYLQSQQILEHCNMNWEHPEVKTIMHSLGDGERMTLKGYEQLYNWLKDIKYERIPF